MNLSPKKASSFAFGLGDYDSGLYFSEIAYKKDKSCDNLYDIVKNSVIFDNYDYAIKYLPILFEQESLSTLLTEQKMLNIAKTNDISQRISYSKEYNMLSNYYVKALMETAKIQNALDYCIKTLYDFSTIDLNTNLANPAFYFVRHQTNNILIIQNSSTYSISLKNVCEVYYNKLKVIYDNIDFDNILSENKLKIATFVSHIIDAGNTLSIISLLNFDSESQTNYENAVNDYNLKLTALFA